MKQRAEEWLDEHDVKRCPSCGNSPPLVSDNLVMLRAIKPGDAPEATPLLVVTCSRCAQVRLFNAIWMRLIPPHHPPANWPFPEEEA